MVFKSKPTESGTYRIKVYNENLYLEAIPQSETSASTPWMRLAESCSSNKQKVSRPEVATAQRLLFLPVELDQSVEHLGPVDDWEQRRPGWTHLQEDLRNVPRPWLPIPWGQFYKLEDY